MAYRFIKHNNKEVLFIDHKGLSGDDLFNSFKEATLFILEKKKDCLVVADFTDTTGTQQLNDYIQSPEAKETSRYTIKHGVVGITGIKKMVLRLYNSVTGGKSKLFATIEEALDYVTSP